MKVWAYIHPQLNTFCCALLEESIPANVEAIEFDVESTDDIIYDGIRIRLKTEAEKLSELRQKKTSGIETDCLFPFTANRLGSSEMH